MRGANARLSLLHFYFLCYTFAFYWRVNVSMFVSKLLIVNELSV